MATPELCRNFLSGVCGRQGRGGTVEVQPIKQPPGVASHHYSCHPVVTAALRSGPVLLLLFNGGVARRCCIQWSNGPFGGGSGSRRMEQWRKWWGVTREEESGSLAGTCDPRRVNLDTIWVSPLCHLSFKSSVSVLCLNLLLVP